MSTIRLLTWNVNGWTPTIDSIKSLSAEFSKQHPNHLHLSVHQCSSLFHAPAGSLSHALDRFGCDILCLQEVKIPFKRLFSSGTTFANGGNGGGKRPLQHPKGCFGDAAIAAGARNGASETPVHADTMKQHPSVTSEAKGHLSMFLPADWESFWSLSHVNSFNGVAVFARKGLVHAADAAPLGRGGNTQWAWLDAEGRCLVVYFSHFILINVYIPNAGSCRCGVCMPQPDTGQPQTCDAKKGPQACRRGAKNEFLGALKHLTLRLKREEAARVTATRNVSHGSANEPGSTVSTEIRRIILVGDFNITYRADDAHWTKQRLSPALLLRRLILPNLQYNLAVASNTCKGAYERIARHQKRQRSSGDFKSPANEMNSESSKSANRVRSCISMKRPPLALSIQQIIWLLQHLNYTLRNMLPPAHQLPVCYGGKNSDISRRLNSNQRGNDFQLSQSAMTVDFDNAEDIHRFVSQHALPAVMRLFTRQSTSNTRSSPVAENAGMNNETERDCTEEEIVALCDLSSTIFFSSQTPQDGCDDGDNDSPCESGINLWMRDVLDSIPHFVRWYSSSSGSSQVLPAPDSSTMNKLWYRVIVVGAVGQPSHRPEDVHWLRELIEPSLAPPLASSQKENIPCRTYSTSEQTPDVATSNGGGTESNASVSTAVLPEDTLNQSDVNGYEDSFLRHHPMAGATYTVYDQSTNARYRNIGSRIDYVLVEKMQQYQNNVGAVPLNGEGPGANKFPNQRTISEAQLGNSTHQNMRDKAQRRHSEYRDNEDFHATCGAAGSPFPVSVRSRLKMKNDEKNYYSHHQNISCVRPQNKMDEIHQPKKTVAPADRSANNTATADTIWWDDEFAPYSLSHQRGITLTTCNGLFRPNNEATNTTGFNNTSMKGLLPLLPAELEACLPHPYYKPKPRNCDNSTAFVQSRPFDSKEFSTTAAGILFTPPQLSDHVAVTVDITFTKAKGNNNTVCCGASPNKTQHNDEMSKAVSQSQSLPSSSLTTRDGQAYRSPFLNNNDIDNNNNNNNNHDNDDRCSQGGDDNTKISSESTGGVWLPPDESTREAFYPGPLLHVQRSSTSTVMGSGISASFGKSAAVSTAAYTPTLMSFVLKKRKQNDIHHEKSRTAQGGVSAKRPSDGLKDNNNNDTDNKNNNHDDNNCYNSSANGVTDAVHESTPSGIETNTSNHSMEPRSTGQDIICIVSDDDIL